MTKSELIQQALTEYEQAQGRPCTDAVTIAKNLNRKGQSASVETVQDPKHPIQIADENIILAFTTKWGIETYPLKKYDFSTCIRQVESVGNDQDKWEASGAHKRVLAIEKELPDGYMYRADFGADTTQREVTTTTETPSRAEIELGDGETITRQDVATEMRAG